MSGYLSGLESELLSDIRKKSRNLIYQTDPQAWLWDILGVKLWSLQAEIMESVQANTYTLVKSCNGVGKTQVAGFAVSWFANVFEPLETSIMVSAPVRAQIDEMMFRYLRAAYQMSIERGRRLVGEIMPRQPRWIVSDTYKHDLVVPKRPADSNLLSSFQGTHNTHVMVGLDEAGGLQEDFYIGANAVTTNEHARILAIGNPDRLNTAFHRRFKDRKTFASWNTITIGASQTPNFTGEMIYPDDPELDRKIKSRLVQVEWAEEMRRSALPGVVKAKVDGEFPDEDDNTFFGQDVQDKAHDTDIPETSLGRRWLGVDLAYQGEDKCVAYLNVDGRIRQVAEWNRFQGTEHMQSAHKIHKLAIEHEAHEVRVDRAGTGAGVYSNLLTEEAFAKRRYMLVGVNGANVSPDPNRYLNARAWHYDSFRKGMADGKIDLDLQDQKLTDDMNMQTWLVTRKGQIQITPKVDLKKQGHRSPDHLDAAIYSAIDFSAYTDGAAPGAQAGDVVFTDPLAELAAYGYRMAGMPI